MIKIPDKFHPGHWQQSTRSTTTVVKSKYRYDQEFLYPVTLVWDLRPQMQAWNEICAWVIEHFGLPGHRYRTEITTEKMTWYFTTKQDQLIFILAWGNDNDIDI